jgi:hypothetical protein
MNNDDNEFITLTSLSNPSQTWLINKKYLAISNIRPDEKQNKIVIDTSPENLSIIIDYLNHQKGNPGAIILPKPLPAGCRIKDIIGPYMSNLLLTQLKYEDNLPILDPILSLIRLTYILEIKCLQEVCCCIVAFFIGCQKTEENILKILMPPK